jgi:hypothetical protein
MPKRKATEAKKEQVEEDEKVEEDVGEIIVGSEKTIPANLPAKKAKVKGKSARVDNPGESKDKEGKVGKVTKTNKATKVGKAGKAGKVGEVDNVKGATVVDIEDCHHTVRALVLALAS